MIIANIHKAKTDLSKLISATLAGKDVLIAKNGVPVVKLVQIVSDKIDRVPGLFKGKLKMSKNFNNEFKEINEMFYGE